MFSRPLRPPKAGSGRDNKTMRLVKVLWKHRAMDEATCEREDVVRANYPFLFEDEGMFLVIW